MARHRNPSLYGRGIADFDEFIHKKNPNLRDCLLALCFDPTTLFEIAVWKGDPFLEKNATQKEKYSDLRVEPPRVHFG